MFLLTEGSGDVVVEEVYGRVVEEVDVLIVEVQFDRIEQIVSDLKKHTYKTHNYNNQNF